MNPKSYRVYFNRQMDWPMIWCVDEGTVQSQIRCHWVDMSGAKSAVGNTRIGPGKTKVIPNEPYAWIDVVGVPYLDKGVVRFRK